MSDDELDRDWKPSNRPQSMMALSFSAALNDLFKIDNSLADLDAAVSEKKRVVSFQTSELEALEARIRATEARLAQTKALGASFSSGNGPASPRRVRAPIANTFSEHEPAQRSEGAHRENVVSPPNGELVRPGTSKSSRSIRRLDRPPLPPTPGASEDDTDAEDLPAEDLPPKNSSKASH